MIGRLWAKSSQVQKNWLKTSIIYGIVRVVASLLTCPTIVCKWSYSNLFEIDAFHQCEMEEFRTFWVVVFTWELCQSGCFRNYYLFLAIFMNCSSDRPPVSLCIYVWKYNFLWTWISDIHLFFFYSGMPYKSWVWGIWSKHMPNKPIIQRDVLIWRPIKVIGSHFMMAKMTSDDF